MNLTLISAAVAAVCGFALAWQLQAHQILEITLEHANERITIQRNARTTLERNQAQFSAATASAMARARVAVAAADVARTEFDRLRVTSTATVRAATAGIDACVGAVHAYDTVFTQCAAQLVDVARDATGHASDVQALTEAWPR